MYMTKKINSYILPDNIISKMKEEIKQTKKLKIEHGFALCKDDGVIKKGSECTGTKCEIKEGFCPKNLIHIGDYHTHPKGAATMSFSDMSTGCLAEMECIGSVPFNKIRCFVRKTEYAQCQKDVNPFIEKERILRDRRDDIAKTLKNPLSIVRKGIYNTAKELINYEREIDEYTLNRAKTLTKNFGQIEIK